MKPIKTLLALALSGLVMSAFAQMGPGSAAGPDSHNCMGGHQSMREHMGERMAQRAKVLHDKLKLNPDQEEAWKTLQSAMKPPAEHKRLDMAEMEKLTAPERMEKMQEQMKQHQEAMGTRLQAVKAFYAKLSPEQQKTFDQESLAPWKKAAERRNAKRGAKPAAK